MARVPRLSIASKLYAIFALLATATVVLALVAVVSARRHAALTNEFEAALQGSQNVERVNGLIYAVVMESRGVYMSTDAPTVKKYADGLLKFNDQIAEVVNDWERAVRLGGRRAVRGVLQAHRAVHRFPQRAGAPRHRGQSRRRPRVGRQRRQPQRPHGAEQGPGKARRALCPNAQETHLCEDRRGHRVHHLAHERARRGSRSARRDRRRHHPARGDPSARPTSRASPRRSPRARAVAVPYGSRRDEIGALARSIGVFQRAMRRNEELNRTVVDDAEARAQRQEQMSGEIAASRPGSSATSASSAASPIRCWRPRPHLAEAADQRVAPHRRRNGRVGGGLLQCARHRVGRRRAVGLGERDRPPGRAVQRHRRKAVGEAERTNTEIKALDEAAKRIGDVVKLITAIAEQTNLLALNATIEAARAGEAGRGFAVVAHEVKALAGQTAKATEEITGQIAGMQQATVRSVDAIASIQRTIREVGDITATIAAAVTEQGAATQEIARSAEVASRRTIETASEVDRVGEATGETRSNATDGQDRVRRTRRRRQGYPRPGRRLLREAARGLDRYSDARRTPPRCDAAGSSARPARHRSECPCRRCPDDWRARLRRPR